MLGHKPLLRVGSLNKRQNIPACGGTPVFDWFSPMSMRRAELLGRLDLTPAELTPEAIEVWGDDFSAVRGGIDLDMCRALPPAVRTIDFRDEDPAELPADRNIVLWDGAHRLQDGLLEFLETR